MHAISRMTSLLCTAAVCLGLPVLQGCQQKPAEQPAGAPPDLKEPFAVTMLNTSFQPDEPGRELWKRMETYTGAELDVTWVPNASYNDKLNIALASGNLPMIVKADSTKLPGIANAIKAGAFWELGPYLDDFPNLRQADPDILRNVSTEGKIYGIYRARELGRMGISYRKDWLDRVGLRQPRTIDDFYNMLKAFTYNDPDGNGRDDTYGMVATKYESTWDIIGTWFGAPNKWGFDRGGKLVPAHMTDAYMDALRFFRKLYEEGLVNRDFPIYDTARWYDPVVNGNAGVIVDVADTAGRLESALARTNPRAKIDVLGAAEGPHGLRNLSTSGYSGVFLISKAGVKTERDLRKVLAFLDKLNDPAMQKLLAYGIEGFDYTVKGGRLVAKRTEEIPPEYRLGDMGQLLMMIPDRTATPYKPATPLREKIGRVYQENKRIDVPNPAEPLLSGTYLAKGAQLDRMIGDARIDYIIGRLDEAGFREAVRRWRESGGDDYIREINEAYARMKRMP